MTVMIPYLPPREWFAYDAGAVAPTLVDAKAAVQALLALPYQMDWVEELQKVQLKREVAGTSRIEGADLTERELEEAVREGFKDLLTRSQRQASAAARAYREIAKISDDAPLDANLVRQIHRLLIEGADDDHCQPGALRGPDHNVTFGSPVHRGAEGGAECRNAFGELIHALNTNGRGQDTLILALAAHYHLAAIHPFHDGNGRTARAVEALLLGRAGLRDICFVGMSNYYYDEKLAYLTALSETRRMEHDLTPFLVFALKGVQRQSQLVQKEIRTSLAKALFRNTMHSLYSRLKGPKTRVLKDRQLQILEILLGSEPLASGEFIEKTNHLYVGLGSVMKAMRRDVDNLRGLGAAVLVGDGNEIRRIKADLNWPTKFSETKFFQDVKRLPKAKTLGFL